MFNQIGMTLHAFLFVLWSLSRCLSLRPTIVPYLNTYKTHSHSLSQIAKNSENTSILRKNKQTKIIIFWSSLYNEIQSFLKQDQLQTKQPHSKTFLKLFPPIPFFFLRVNFFSFVNSPPTCSSIYLSCEWISLVIAFIISIFVPPKEHQLESKVLDKNTVIFWIPSIWKLKDPDKNWNGSMVP